VKAKAAVDEAIALLRPLGDPARAEAQQRYLKSRHTFYGVTVPVLRAQAKDYARAHPARSSLARRAWARALWATEIYELRSFAIAVLEREAKQLVAADARWLIELVATADTWAHVDWLATKVIGALVAADPSLSPRLDEWAEHEVEWVRRTALLALHDPIRAGGGDFAHFERLAVPMLTERGFFIRKAIGWVLRSASARGPGRTIGFVERHAAALSGLSFREATRNLPAREQQRLTALRARASRPRPPASKAAAHTPDDRVRAP
jgi:3-methyladenine DNA glycosylase AlkD